MQTIEGKSVTYPFLLPLLTPESGRPAEQRHGSFATVGHELYAALCVCNIRPWSVYDIRLHLLRRRAMAETIWSCVLAHFGFRESIEWRWGTLHQLAPSRILHPERGNTAPHQVVPDGETFENFVTEVPAIAAKLLSICEWRGTNGVQFRVSFLGDGSSDFVLWAYDQRAKPATLAVLAWDRRGIIIEPPQYWGT